MAILQIAFLSSPIIGFLLPLYAAITGSHRAAYVAAAFSLPACIYAAGAPSFYYVPIVFPILTIAGGRMLDTKRTVALWLLFSPHIITALWFLIRIAVEA